MFVDFLLIKIGFLAIVGSAFGTVDSNGFILSNRHLLKENIEFE
jgi:hypothetical protein